MKVLTYEGIVENGRIRVQGDAKLPEKAKVCVIFPEVYEIEVPKVAHIASPRLANPEQASDFFKMVTDVEKETDADAGGPRL